MTMLPNPSLRETVADRASRWAFRPRASYAGGDIRSRNAFYGATTRSSPAIAVRWNPQHRFEDVSAEARLQCAEGDVCLWISRAAAFPQAPFSLFSVLPDLPHALRCAALEELLGDLLRHWALTHGLTLLSMQVNALHTSLSEAQQRSLAFCQVWAAQQQIALLAAASTASSGVQARLGRLSRCSTDLLSCTARVSLRTPLLHLPVDAARACTPGDGIDLGTHVDQGLTLLLCDSGSKRTLCCLNWKGNRMSIEHTTNTGLLPGAVDPVAVHDLLQTAPPPASRVDHLSLRLSVEVASLNVAVGEMALWRAGHVLALDLPLDSAAVSLLINERLVGRGQIVVLDDRLAVEVTEWLLVASDSHAV